VIYDVVWWWPTAPLLFLLQFCRLVGGSACIHVIVIT
jgi:hypothetical protein